MKSKVFIGDKEFKSINDAMEKSGEGDQIMVYPFPEAKEIDGIIEYEFEKWFSGLMNWDSSKETLRDVFTAGWDAAVIHLYKIKENKCLKTPTG